MADTLSKQPLAEQPGHDVSPDSNQASRAAAVGSEPAIDPSSLTEGEFFDYILEQLRSGQWTGSIHLSDADLEAIEAEPIGEHFTRYPFLY